MALNPTPRQTVQAAIAIAMAMAIFAGVALAGCKNKTDTTTANPPTAPALSANEPAAGTSAGTPAPMMVTTVDLGNTVGDDNRVSAPMTSFTPGDTIHVSVATVGGTASTLTAKWMYQDGQVVDTTSKSVAGGPQVTDFSISKPDGWPLGNYTLEVQKNGSTVQMREFAVKQSNSRG